MNKPKFSPGNNIAIKVPAHEYDAMVTFYQCVLGLVQKNVSPAAPLESISFEYGDKNLWLDKVSGLSQAEIWLEINTDDVVAAKRYLQAEGCTLRDDIEPLPSGYSGFWLSSPSNIIQLVSECQIGD